MATTSQIRSWWSPPCVGPFVKVELYGAGVVSVRPQITAATHALDACFRHHNYLTRRVDTGAYNCRKITGGTGYSLHAYGIAVDVNWQSNPYGPRLVTDMPKGLIRSVKAIRTNSGVQVWRWGGDYLNNKDAMHFEVVASPRDLKTGIDPRTVPGASKETDDMTPEQDKLLRAVELRSIAFDQRLARLERAIAALVKDAGLPPVK